MRRPSPITCPPSLAHILAPGLAFAIAGAGQADISPTWLSAQPVGSSLSAGMSAMVTGADGVTFVTGINGPSSNVDIVTTAFGADGSQLWTHTFNGPSNWHDQSRGIALGPGGVVWVCGNTPGPGTYANVLLLKYSAATGALLDTVQYSSGPFTSEHAQSIAVDGQGNVFVTGGTVGDGADAMTLKFDGEGNFLWKRAYDGPAFGPFSQDSAWKVLLAPDGHPVVMVHGVMASNQPDYVVIKHSAADGTPIWTANWGVNGGDYPSDMAIDADGDVYVTGTGIDLIDKYSTIKLRGTDGALLWQRYDSAGNDNSARAITLDGAGGVYVTGAADPEGNLSNFNDNIFTVKRDAGTGAFVWSHLYGANCVGCLDVGQDVRVDAGGHVLVGGHTNSAPYSSDAIVLILDEATGVELDRGIYFAEPLEQAEAARLALDAAGNLHCGGSLYHVNSGAVRMSVARFESLVAPFGVGDVDGNGSVDGADLAALLASWGPCGRGPCPCDLDGDGMVDGSDLAMLLAAWG